MSTARIFKLNALYWAVDRLNDQPGGGTPGHRTGLSRIKKDDR